MVRGAAQADDRAFEDLNPFLIPFFDPDVDAHGVARAERGNIFLHLLLFDLVENIHYRCTPGLEMGAAAPFSLWGPCVL
jgi:hypothetical protein